MFLKFKMKNNSNGKCCVCGDKAFGLNFSALTCLSCKAFFMRNSNKELMCFFENNCEIGIDNRKKCKRCRLEKCLKIGMTKVENVEEKKSQENCLLREILQVDKDLEKLDKTRKQLKSRKSPFTLKSYEKSLIAETVSTMNSVFADERKLPVVGEIPSYHASLKLGYPSMYLRRIVGFCKNFAAFKQLNRSDQLIIMRQFVVEIIVVRTSFLFDKDKNGYPIIENEEGKKAIFLRNEVGTSLLLKCHEDRLAYNRNLRQSLTNELEDDSTIRDLIIMILMFQPRENISCPEFIKYQHTLHCSLLRRYLQCKYRNMVQANRKYAKLLELICLIDVVKENYRAFCFVTSLNLLPEILVEVLDLPIQKQTVVS